MFIDSCGSFDEDAFASTAFPNEVHWNGRIVTQQTSSPLGASLASQITQNNQKESPLLVMSKRRGEPEKIETEVHGSARFKGSEKGAVASGEVNVSVGRKEGLTGSVGVGGTVATDGKNVAAEVHGEGRIGYNF